MDEIKTQTGSSTLGGAFISIKLNENEFNLIFKLLVKQLKPISHNRGKLVYALTKPPVLFCFFLNTVGAVSPDHQRSGPKPREMFQQMF